MNVHRGRAQGFTLIEVLITIAVVSIGLLAVAGLQALAKQANYDALQRTTAAALGQAIIERIRANPRQSAVYQTDATTGISELNPAAAASCDVAVLTASTTPACTTPVQVAAANLYDWSQELFGAAEAASATGSSAAASNLGGLQNATGCITFSSPTNTGGTSGAVLRIYTVAIAWRGLSPVPAAGTSATDPSSNSCGMNRYLLGDHVYDPPVDASSSMTMRRILVLQAAIISPS